MRISLVVALLVVVLVAPCYADGNELLDYCNAAIEPVDKQDEADIFASGYCLGLLQGIIDQNKLYEYALGSDAYFCTPAGGIKTVQAARIVIKFLSENPDKLHMGNSVLASAALVRAFPCNKEQKQIEE